MLVTLEDETIWDWMMDPTTDNPPPSLNLSHSEPNNDDPRGEDGENKNSDHATPSSNFAPHINLPDADSIGMWA